ncbi:D-glucuronyl C5-epimerase-like [Argonauta hians]
MRVSVKFIILFGIVVLCVILLSWFRCPNTHITDDSLLRNLKLGTDYKESHINQRGAKSLAYGGGRHYNSLPYDEVECLINKEYTVKCRREGKETFIPFSFIERYFEVYGSVSHSDAGLERFEWQHSYSQVYPQKKKYSPSGVFMSFEHYNVEVRDRVKCISGMEGVPVSTQWGPQGHHYPIQIAQFGLSHYSKFLIEDKPDVIVLEDGTDDNSQNWYLPNSRTHVKTVEDPEVGKVVEFDAPESLNTPGISMDVEEDSFLVSFDFLFVSNGSITVSVKLHKDRIFHIHYVFSNTLISIDRTNIYYGLGEIPQSWRHLTRDIAIDFQKGMGLQYSKVKKGKLRNIIVHITAITLHGQGQIDNITVSSAAHLDQFYDAANWLVKHQDDQGGWPIMVARKLSMLELEPGWYSAMAQGQAMSLLVRAYIRTKNPVYLTAAINGLKLYQVSSADGGVMAKYAGVYTWYEEYPTQPSSFVLNGFIYSLLGLYDVKEIATGTDKQLAQMLFDTGMHSLKHMLLLFDNGSGTFYDLRHLTLGITPNRARWDYHTTHINQILLLSTIDDNPLFKNTADRWISYMKGRRAPHN